MASSESFLVHLDDSRISRSLHRYSCAPIVRMDIELCS